MRVSENSRDRYLHSYRTFVQGVFDDQTLAQLAQDRVRVTGHLTVTIGGPEQHTAPADAVDHRGTCEEAVKAGGLAVASAVCFGGAVTIAGHNVRSEHRLPSSPSVGRLPHSRWHRMLAVSRMPSRAPGCTCLTRRSPRSFREIPGGR